MRLFLSNLGFCSLEVSLVGLVLKLELLFSHTLLVLKPFLDLSLSFVVPGLVLFKSFPWLML